MPKHNYANNSSQLAALKSLYSSASDSVYSKNPWLRMMKTSQMTELRHKLLDSLPNKFNTVNSLINNPYNIQGTIESAIKEQNGNTHEIT